jgi:T5SS/PEP-CTERM-associated repeat protein
MRYVSANSLVVVVAVWGLSCPASADVRFSAFGSVQASTDISQCPNCHTVGCSSVPPPASFELPAIEGEPAQVSQQSPQCGQDGAEGEHVSVGPVSASGGATGDPNSGMTVSFSGAGAASHSGDHLTLVGFAGAGGDGGIDFTISGTPTPVQISPTIEATNDVTVSIGLVFTDPNDVQQDLGHIERDENGVRTGSLPETVSSVGTYSLSINYGGEAYQGIGQSEEDRPTFDFQIIVTVGGAGGSAAEFHWVNAAGGSYSDANNWNPPQVPVHNDQRSDTAIFDLATSAPLRINAVGGSAGRILVQNSSVDITADTTAAATSEDEPSVTVGDNGRLNVVAGTLHSVHSTVGFNGAGAAQALVSNNGTRWENSGRIVVGQNEPARLFVFDGFLASAEARIGGANGTGDVQVSGPHAIWNSGSLAVGFGGQPGTLTIDHGGVVSNEATDGLATIGFAAGTGNQVSVEGTDANTNQPSSWQLAGELHIGEAGEGTLEIVDGGSVTSGPLTVANGPAAGTLIVRGRSGAGAPSTLRTNNAGAEVGEAGIGSLQVLDGAEATVEGDLGVGNGGAGTVVISGFAQTGGQEHTDQPAHLTTQNGLSLGEAAPATLQVQRGGLVEIRDDIVVNFAEEGSQGRILVDGQGGGTAAVHTLKNLRVGGPGQADSNDPEVEILNGGTVVARGLTIGDNPSAARDARVLVRGSAGDNSSQLNVQVLDEDPNAPSGELTIVGASGAGELTLEAGGQAQLTGGLVVGESSAGRVHLDGSNAPELQPTHLTVNGEPGTTLDVGVGGVGNVEIEHGGQFVSELDVRIGVGASEQSSIVVHDERTDNPFQSTPSLELDDRDLVVGVRSSALLRADQGGFIHCRDAFVGGEIPAGEGGLHLNHGSTMNCTGDLHIGPAAALGEVLVLADSTLNVQGNVTVRAPTGSFSLLGIQDPESHLFVGQRISVGDGAILAGRGSIDCFALDAAPNARISPGLDIQERFIGPFKPRHATSKSGSRSQDAAQSTIGTLTVNGDYEQQDDAVLVIEVAGLEPGQFDVLRINGNATLDGTLEAHFLDGFLPKAGDSVDFVQITGGVIGSFAQVSFPELAPGFDADLTLTADGKLRLTARSDAVAGDGTSITPSNDLAAQLAAPLPPACGAGLCGAGLVPMLPITLVGLLAMRVPRRRPRGERR